MWSRIKRWWASDREQSEADYRSRLEDLRKRRPVPVFWLFGKTQSGKTTVVRFLTGATDAEIGNGFQPCTRFSRQYDFPNSEAELLQFLDTRGVDEPGYDPAEDLTRFNEAAHVVIVTVKAMDHAQENVLKHLKTIRDARPARPVLLLLTCLHEAYPQQQHPAEYPFKPTKGNEPIILTGAPAQLADLRRCLEQQRQRFADMVDFVLPIDVTRPEEGFDQPEFGGAALREVLTELLPHAQRHTLQMVENSIADIKELHARKVLPTILGYTVLAGSAGAIPIPFVSLVVLPRIQRQMIRDLAKDFGRPMSAEQFVELAEKLGIGNLRYHAVNELLKFVPYVGVLTGAAGHAATTYALGKAFCHYDASLAEGMTPDLDKLREYYQSQIVEARRVWKSEPSDAVQPTAP